MLRYDSRVSPRVIAEARRVTGREAARATIAILFSDATLTCQANRTDHLVSQLLDDMSIDDCPITRLCVDQSLEIDVDLQMIQTCLQWMLQHSDRIDLYLPCANSLLEMQHLTSNL